MRRPGLRSAMLWILILGSALLLTACGDDAFESNDYYATFLTSQPTGKQVANSSARADNASAREARAAMGILQAGDVIDEIAQADELRDEATGHFDNGDDDLAATALDGAIEIRPQDPAIRHDRAIVALAQGDLATAKQSWEAQDSIAEKNGWKDDAWYWGEALAEADAVVTMGYSSGSLASESGEGLAAALYRASDVYLGAAYFAESQGDAVLAEEYHADSEDYQNAAFNAKTPDD